uniref:VWFA domain-containing protein n=1 Tax=Candidatus Methanogaster sp. ANME-2c ERB4 TaxID=2759911 RepID=A0A7G9YJ47_9EURY|nr:hypothetical protein CAKHPDBP_00002 [Methanosarcinales archaeon ANME-2c ERB4]
MTQGRNDWKPQNPSESGKVYATSPPIGDGVSDMRCGSVILCMVLLLPLMAIASADTLDITTETDETFADNRTVNITVTLANATGHPLNNTRVNFTTTIGTLSLSHNYTDTAGIAVVTISSSEIGTAKITAEAQAASNTANVTFVVGPPDRIQFHVNGSAVVNTTCVVSAEVYDSMDRLLLNTTINFTMMSPPDNLWNSPIEYNNAFVTPSSNITDGNGTTTVTAYLDKRAGSNMVTAKITTADIVVNEYVTIIGVAGYPVKMPLVPNPARVVANNIETSRVTGEVIDEFSNPLLSRGSIRFNVSGSEITMPLDGYGTAEITLKPSIFPGNITVNGTHINEAGDDTSLTNETVVKFYVEEPARIVVVADATRISISSIGGVNESVITATVVDKWDHVLQNRTVNFSTTLGSLSSTTVTTDKYGQATVTLQSAISGDATVTADACNDSGVLIEGDIAIQVMGTPFISVISTIEPDPIEQGGIINVTTIVSGQGNITGTRLSAHAMLVLDRSGSMDPDYYAGTPLDVALVLDRSGSMAYLGSNPQQPMTAAKTAAKVFMDNLVSNAQVGVVSFSSGTPNSRIDIGLTLLNSSDGKVLVRSAIDGISATGNTAIGDGIADANNMLMGGRTGSRKIVILLTDGVCNTGGDQDCSQAIATANANGITIYTIGLGSAEYIDEPLLQRVASGTGGTYYNAPSSSELRAVYNSIAQEISDYDITEIEYGTAGFTPYNYGIGGSVDLISYTLRFDGYDFDTTFTHDDSVVGECLIRINGVNFISIPPPASNDCEWVDDYEYDITSCVRNGSNTVTFYDYHEYAGLSSWTSRVRNVDILEDGVVIANYPADTDLSGSGYAVSFDGDSAPGFEDTFLINETINDLKVLLQWENSTTDLNIELVSPGGHVYGTGNDTTGYYFDDREAIPIDVRSPEFDIYIASASPDTIFADETSFCVTDDLTGGGEQASTIMRWELPGAPTHNARIESVTMYLRGMDPNPTPDPGNEHRSVNIYDLTTSYNDDPTWNYCCNSTPQAWASGGSFSGADNDSYLIDSVALTESIEGDVIEFDITSADWSGNRLPDWGAECNIVLTGSGYNGKGADRSASGETNPNGHTYTLNGYRPLVTITYSIPGDTSDYIWIHPLSYTYPATDTDTVENGDWTLRVTGSGNGSERFNITTYIDKKSAAKLASHAFISSLDPTRADRVGLATYSYSSTNDTTDQTSYVCEENQWEGYFSVNTPAIYYFNLTWDDASDLDLHLYDGITLLDSSSASNPETVTATLSSGTNYRVVVNGTAVIGDDTRFTINTSSSELREIMCAYYDSNSASVPRYRQLEGALWSDETDANNIGGTIRWLAMQSCPTRDEMIMGAVDSSYDVNVQVRDGSAWSAPQQFTGSLDSYTCRGFDIAYEQITGDAIVAYVDTGLNDGVPQYRIWDGTGWTGGAFVNSTNPGAGDIWWVKLAADPNSDEIILVTLDDVRDIRSQVWDGSNWGNPITITDDSRAYGYQCFDVVYDRNGNAIVVWSDRSTSTVRSRVWNGSAWGAVSDIYTFTDSVYWIKLAADPNSDNILMGALNEAKDVHVTVWNGSAWSPNLKIEENTYECNKRIMDVCFEQSSGRGLVVWGDSTPTPKYRIWNGSWGEESSAPNLGGTGYTRWAQLIPDPDSDEMFLMTSDGDNDINIQKWDGSAWGIPTEVETSSARDYECFDLTYSQQDASRTQATVDWLEWRAQIDETLANSAVSFNPINSSIDSLTADGMTAIDEGLFNANNGLADYENATIVLMTDGIDNVGYHSMIAEAERAAANNITIFTVGFGATIDCDTLMRIANITGGEYYFAPNATVLKNIFVGIAGELGNYTAPEPKINIHIGNNATIDGSYTNVTYIKDSANVTYFNRTTEVYETEYHLNPNVAYAGNRTILSWDVGNRPEPYEITVGKYWMVTYQLRIDNNSAGMTPVIISPSSISYIDSNSTATIETIPDATVTVEGNATPDVHTESATGHYLEAEALYQGPLPLRTSSTSPSQPKDIREYAYELTMHLAYSENGTDKPVAWGTLVEFEVTSGVLYNTSTDTASGRINETTASGGKAIAWVSSDAPGTITVCARHTTEDDTYLNDTAVIIFHSLESPPIIPPAPKPRGVITLE